MNDAEGLRLLAERAGIEPVYWDIRGNRYDTSDETRRALLGAMGLPAATRDDVHGSLAAMDLAPWRRSVEPVLVVREEALPASISLTVEAARAEEPVSWRLVEEGGRVHRGSVRPAELPLETTREVDGRALEKRRFELPVRPPLGYHRLSLSAAEREDEARLIVVPTRCYLPPELDDAGRLWGLSTQLYALRSDRNWGVGDFTDLARLMKLAASLGAAGVGLNPLHALFPDNPAHCSP